MINLFPALQKLYPQVVTLTGDVATDIDGNEVAYDLAAVQAEAEAAQAAKQAVHDAATAKLKNSV